MKNVYGKDINDNTRLTRHYQDWEVELAKPNKDYITTDYFCPKRDVSYDDCLLKLGKLEDIEEELGINLVTLITAIKNGFWSIEPQKAFFYPNNFDIDIANKCIHNTRILGHDRFYFKDYGKTWALTKEELE